MKGGGFYKAMRLSYYCGCYKQITSLIDEPLECETEGEIDVDEDDWKQENVCINCPQCGAELHQSMDHFEISKNRKEKRKTIFKENY